MCSNCDGKCPVCESLVNASIEAHVCDECAFGAFGQRCISCGNKDAVATARFCQQCVLQEKDRDGCPKIVNVGGNTVDSHFERQK